jgi:hypothetical protein
MFSSKACLAHPIGSRELNPELSGRRGDQHHAEKGFEPEKQHCHTDDNIDQRGAGPDADCPKHVLKEMTLERIARIVPTPGTDQSFRIVEDRASGVE